MHYIKYNNVSSEKKTWKIIPERMIIVMKSILFTIVKKEQYILRLFFFKKCFTS